MHIHKSLVVATAVVGLVGGPVFAGTSVGVSAGTNIGASATTNNGSNTSISGSANVRTNVATSANTTAGEIVSSIDAAKLDATDIEALTTVKRVNVIKILSIAKKKERATVNQEVAKMKGDIASLRSALTANTPVKTALADAHVKIKAVVAAKATSDGMLTVYVL